MRSPLHAGRAALAAVLLAGPLAMPAPNAGAADSPTRATPAPSPEQQAFRHYQTGRPDLAIELLEAYVKRALRGRALLQARELMAQCYVRVKRNDDAVGMFRVMLYQQPSYRPGSRLLADERAAFDSALAQHSAEVGSVTLGSDTIGAVSPGMTAKSPAAQARALSGPPPASAPPARTSSPTPSSLRLAGRSEPPPMPVSQPRTSRAWMWWSAAFVLTSVGTALVVDGLGQD